MFPNLQKIILTLTTHEFEILLDFRLNFERMVDNEDNSGIAQLYKYRFTTRCGLVSGR